jgi:hypothetical protein
LNIIDLVTEYFVNRDVTIMPRSWNWSRVIGRKEGSSIRAAAMSFHISGANAWPTRVSLKDGKAICENVCRTQELYISDPEFFPKLEKMVFGPG